MEQKNLEELYHKGELEWEEGEYTVCRGFPVDPSRCHNSCGILYYLKDGVMDHARVIRCSPTTTAACARAA